MFRSAYSGLHHLPCSTWQKSQIFSTVLIARLLARHICCQPSWKFSASVIVAFKQTLVPQLQENLPINHYSSIKFHHDYSILLFKRPHSSSSFKDKIVFPGGVVSRTDFSEPDWNELVPRDLQFEARSRPPMYRELTRQFQLNKQSDSLHPSVGLRLCALRELFEETGVLLVETTRRNEARNNDAAPECSASAVILAENEMRFWQERLINEPNSFAKLYMHVGEKPPLAALYEWSNWLTPQKFHPRFDTLFYFVQLDSVVSRSDRASSDREWLSREVGTLYADNPAAFLYSSTRSLVPPQIYELGRLSQFIHLETLTAFACQRASLGCRRWCPVPIDLTVAGQRCTIYFLPGDERYDQVASGSKATGQLTAADLAHDTHRNRLVLSSEANQLWYDTTVYELGHVPPVTRAEYRALSTSMPSLRSCV